MLLTKGHPAFSGAAADALPYFAALGYELPPFVNPAEHLIDIAAVDIRSPELEEASSARVEGIKAAWRAHAQEKFSENDESRPRSSELPSQSNRVSHAELSRQIRVLTARTWITTIRDPMGMFGSFLEAIAMAIITGYIFFQLGEDQSGIRSRQGALYIASSLQGYLILQFEVYRLTIDIELFDRERGEGVVSVPGFLISRRLARLLIEDFPVPLMFSLIFYFMAGFRTDGPQFMTFFAVILLEQYIAVCFAMTCVAVSRTFAGASLVANMAYTLQSMACGYFIQSNTIPVYVRWTKWTAYCVSEVLYLWIIRHTSKMQELFFRLTVSSSTRSAHSQRMSSPAISTPVPRPADHQTQHANSTPASTLWSPSVSRPTGSGGQSLSCWPSSLPSTLARGSFSASGRWKCK